MRDNKQILSYYYEFNGKIYKEFLFDHVKTMLNLVRHSMNSPLSRFVKRVMKRESLLKINFYDMVRLSIIFHDTGKIFYQRAYREIDGKRYLSFRGHEYFSAYFFEKFKRELVEDGVQKSKELRQFEYYGACTFAILYHHHAMGLRRRKTGIYVSSYNLKCSIEFMDDLERLSTFLPENEVYVFSKMIVTIKNEVNNPRFKAEVLESIETEKLWRNYVSKPFFKKLSLALLSILLTADYLAAKKTRGNRKSRFHEVLEEYYNFYLKPIT